MPHCMEITHVLNVANSGLWGISNTCLVLIIIAMLINVGIVSFHLPPSTIRVKVT